MSDDITVAARRRMRRLVARAAVVVLALAAVVTWLAVALARQPATPQAPVPSTVETEPVGPSASAPDQLVWVSVAGATVPVSTTAGPYDTTDGRARGFAHSPLGAVLAAVHITVRLCPQVGPAVFQPTLREQVVGPDAAALREQLDEDYQTARARLGVPLGAPAGRLYSTTVGYRVEMLGLDAATVGLLIEGPGPDAGSVLVALVAHVEWAGADWVLQVPARGDWNPTVVADTSGYTTFSGRSTDVG